MSQATIPQLIQTSIDLMEGHIGEQLADVLNVSSNSISMWRPEVDIVENDKTVLIYVNIPGISSDNIDLDFFNNYVTIKGNRKQPNIENGIFRKKEIPYGKCERKIMLPLSVTNQESVKVIIQHGVLIININKETEGQNKFSVSPREE
jgi:HSP20 family protein